jgi:cytochrome c556
MKRVTFSLACLLLAAPLLAAPSDAVQTRVAGFRELGAAFKAVKDGLNASELPTILIQQSARQIHNAAAQMPGWFPAGSGPQPGVKTSAKPEIWAQPAKFKAAQTAFIAQAAKFQAAANTGNAAAIHTEAVALAGTCKSCHDSFRVPGS